MRRLRNRAAWYAEYVKRRLNLPVSAQGPDGLPTIDAARVRLGGRATSSRLAGTIVSLESAGGAQGVGVVLFAGELECDVWIAEGIVRRTAISDVTRFDGHVDDATLRIAADARRYTSLVEGQHVQIVEPDAPSRTATIVEKCRYGALVALADGRVLAVGFRKLVADASAFGS